MHSGALSTVVLWLQTMQYGRCYTKLNLKKYNNNTDKIHTSGTDFVQKKRPTCFGHQRGDRQRRDTKDKN